jgi:predicted acylesterase/phospholipase RssA
LGGAAAGYLQAHPEVMRNLKNGLEKAENLKFATERNVEALATKVVDQLCRLPLVRGETLGDTTFRILSLDGGGIKGTFTAAVLAKLEETIGCRVTDHFDLIAGTSTGGILALGLGMGLSAADILNFYEQRGPTVFPITSLGSKLSYSVAQLFKPKYAQDVLRRELSTAFDRAPGKVMHDSACRLVIPAAHARTGSVHLFRTNHHPDLLAHRNAPAIDVALATAAAPTCRKCRRRGLCRWRGLGQQSHPCSRDRSRVAAACSAQSHRHIEHRHYVSTVLRAKNAERRLYRMALGRPHRGSFDERAGAGNN